MADWTTDGEGWDTDTDGVLDCSTGDGWEFHDWDIRIPGDPLDPVICLTCGEVRRCCQ